MHSLTFHRPLLRSVALIAALVTLGACESEGAPTTIEPVVDPSINQIVTTAPINAKSNDTLVYFSFATSALVPKTAAWDIALRRYEVRLNSQATAGSANRGVTAYSIGNNKNLTNAQIIALTTQSTLPAFDAIRESAIPADGEFQSETLVEDRNAYLNLGGAPTVNSAAYWKVKTTTGYAIFRVASIALSASNGLGALTVESRVETGATLGPVQTLALTLSTTPVHVNLTQNSVAQPNGCNWDLQIAPVTFSLITNAECAVGTYPGGSSPNFASQTVASDAPHFANFVTVLSAPIPNSFSDTEAPFRYNLDGTSRLHPVFNTYLIKVDARVYKLQLTNYYDNAGASGSPTLRYARIK